jgi:hypothetical protein
MQIPNESFMQMEAVNMRIGIVIALAAVLAIPCYGAKRINVAELEQTLASSEAAHQEDATVARQLSAMVLTERLSTARLERLKAGLPGVKSQTALLALADSSAFLNPPATESLAKPEPDQAALYRMMASVVNYESTTLQHLPNFIATREITSFERQPPQFTLRSTSVVTYRNGQEVVETADAKSKNLPQTGLVTHGVFGPILGTVLRDALTGSVRWGRWEAGTNGAVAVILYAVPLEKSHYSVWSSGSVLTSIYNYNPRGDVVSIGDDKDKPVAYHGEIAFDPVSGAILRIAIVADMLPNDSIIRSDIAVEYGSVEIGGKSYICPMRSISLLVEYASANHNGLPQRLLNDVVYQQYRRFGSEMRILTPDAIEPAVNP